MDSNSVAVLISTLLPVVVSLLKRAHYPTTFNAAVALAVYAVAGAAYVAVSGQAVDPNNLVPTIGIFTAGGTVAYQLFWKNWGDPQIQSALASPSQPADPAPAEA